MALFGGKKGADSATNEFVAPEDPDKLVAWLDKKRKQGKTRIPELQMKLNLAYVLGQQWVVWDNDKRTFRRPQNRSDDPNAPVRITVNKIGGIVEKYIAKLTKQAPEPEARPVSDDDDDIGSAKAATRILESELNRLHWNSWLLRHYFWVVTHGWAYGQITWDAEDGGLVAEADDDDDTDTFQGEIRLESVPAFELAVDPNAKTMPEAKWAVRTRTMTREAVWEQYGKLVDAEYERTVADEVYSLVDASYDPHGGDTTNVAVHQLWMVPCRAAAKGLVVTWAGKTILEDPKPYPYKHEALPFVQFDLVPGMGTREGRTWLTDLLALQADYNDARSREAAIRRTLTPKILSPTGSIQPNSLTSRVEVVPYVPMGDKPDWMIPDSGWMSQYEASMSRADAEMGDRAGQSDVASQPKSASMPAAAILALQEADDTKMGIAAHLMADAIQHVGIQVLELVRQFWTEERLVRTWSEEGHLEVAEFTGADITGQLDVHVGTENGIGRSKSAMVQLAMDLWTNKIITDPRHLLRILQMPGTDFLDEVLNVDARQAQRENSELYEGEIVQVNSFDNHQAHIEEHNNFRKGEEYRKIAEAAQTGDQQAVKTMAAIDAHVQAHQEQLGAAQGMVPPLGGPGGPATPGAPPMPPGMPMPAPGAPPPVAGAHPAPHARYVNPATGEPSLAGSAIAARAGIGGPAQPGRVPGISADQQAASMGR